jgi:hypothetical protein
MLINAEEAERRLASGKNLLNVIGRVLPGLPTPPVVVEPIPVKTVTPPIRSEELRVVAGTQAHFKSASTVAAELGITEQQVRSAKNTQNSELAERIARSVEQVQELALLKTVEVLGLLDADAVASEKPRDRAAIAASLSRVYSNVRPAATGNANNVQFVVYAPSIRTEKSFEIVEASVA